MPATSRWLFWGGLAAGLAALAAAVALAGVDAFTDAFAAIGLAGGVAMLCGALLHRAPARPAAAGEASPSEAFLVLAGRAEQWITRTRRYLLLAGVYGLTTWVPLMAFGLLATARGQGVLTVRILAVAGLLAFAGASTLWTKRWVELGHEREAWRVRAAELARLESALLG